MSYSIRVSVTKVHHRHLIPSTYTKPNGHVHPERFTRRIARQMSSDIQPTLKTWCSRQFSPTCGAKTLALRLFNWSNRTKDGLVA
ncbi:Uncharacterized protein HZ326_8456 [Fusarium oxysporum f. sp. albedinis]|nr:Uncharacterized protein HZ326_8456 [Fusarium oxysporum f. sp. albedinis]